MEKEKIRVEVSPDVFLVSQQSIDDVWKEISVWLEDSNGNFIQDLVVVNPVYSLKGGEIEYYEKEFSVKVWSDEYEEDYSHDFIVPLYREDEQHE